MIVFITLHILIAGLGASMLYDSWWAGITLMAVLMVLKMERKP